mmetsp:Transcript_20172/g.63663  ORF Transcript_20172/g.63663 Transcript_20172/m.63663 type:complete len:313 (-) Transcript_20172:522-1460(-)
MLGALDAHRCINRDARLAAGLEKLRDLLPVLVAPVHDVVPEHARNAWVGEDVGVSDQHLVARERPMCLRAAGVMVVDERDSILRHPADEPRRLAGRVPQPPVLAVPRRFLKNALGREVEGGARFARGVDPIAEVLPVLVLVVAEAVVVVLHVTPQLADSPSRLALAAIQAHKIRRITLDKIEAPRLETNLQAQPTQPNANALLHLCICMVDVWCSVKLRVITARRVLAAAVRELVPQGHGPALPIHDTGKAGARLHAGCENVPAPLAVLLVSASVVDDDVGDASDACVAQFAQQRLKGSLRAVLASIKVEEL